MINIKRKLLENKFFFALIFIFSSLRVYIGMNLPIWFFTLGTYDDILMMNFSHLNQHFHQWDILSLTKDMGYPLFLFFVRTSHLPYRFWISVAWIAAAALLVYGINKFITKNRIMLILSYIFILFSPVAFDIWCGGRIYRNSIMMPFTIICLSSLYIFINELLNDDNQRNLIIWGVFAGLAFTFNYYIKEDGVMTLPIFIISILAILLFKLHEERKLSLSLHEERKPSSTLQDEKKPSSALHEDRKFSLTKQGLIKASSICAICLIPIIIFGGCTIFYEEVNYHYFGVHDINTRTSGEVGEFYQNLLLIDADDKTEKVWVSASTVEKAWNASPTLQSHPELLDAYLNTAWGSDIMINSTIKGDIATWSLRKALDDTGLYDNEKEASDLFYNVNNELEMAFENGSLDKSDKIFITRSAAGKDIDEIIALKPLIVSGLKNGLFYEGIDANIELTDYSSSFYSSSKLTNKSEKDLNDELITKEEYWSLPLINRLGIRLIELDVSIYQTISLILIPLSLIGFAAICLDRLRSRFSNPALNVLALYSVLLLGTFLVEVFAISWFSCWIGSSLEERLFILKFYLVPSYGLIAIFIALTISGAFSIIEKKRNLNRN